MKRIWLKELVKKQTGPIQEQTIDHKKHIKMELVKNEEFDLEIKNVLRTRKLFRDTRGVLLDPNDSS